MSPPSASTSGTSRKFLPQPIEETRRTNRVSPSPSLAMSDTNGETKPRRPLPEPMETTTSHSSSKKLAQNERSRDTQLSHDKNSVTSTSRHSNPQPMDEGNPPEPKPRRFAPQVIETSRRRRKSTDAGSYVTHQDMNGASPDDQEQPPEHSRQSRPHNISTPDSPINTPAHHHTEHSSQSPLESKFSSSKLAEKKDRKHSFRIPNLAPIPSISSTESNASSLSTSSSAESDATELGARRRRIRRKKKRKNFSRRESQDVHTSGYYLSLAAKTAAEKQLREQAMAAYPNENAHEPVDHYAFDRDSSDDTDVEAGVGKLSVDGPAEDTEVADRAPARHRDSGSGWDMAEMRKHQDSLEQQRQDQWAAGAKIGDPAELGRRKSTKRAIQEAQEQGAHKSPNGNAGVPPRNIIGWQKDNEMKPMQKAASPPMAGENLQFPKSLSPQATRLDVHQYPGAQKHDQMQSHQHTGLWTPRGSNSGTSSVSGLWNGVCNVANQEQHQPPKIIQTGLLTPGFERSDPYSTLGSATTGTSNSSHHGSLQLPVTPLSSQEETTSLDARLHREQILEAELSDAFVTQVYNYLSLGYPTLARKFDPELSKITRVPVEDLRRDDNRCNAKGYVGAPEGTGADVRGVSEEGEGKCERWCALRLYVREWGRQQESTLWRKEGMGMGGRAVEELEGGWGAPARKGSWAI